MNVAEQFLEAVRHQAAARPRRIVLPEGTEERTQVAVKSILREKLAEVTLLGNLQKIKEVAGQVGLDLGQVKIIDPQQAPDHEEMAGLYYELRRHKGVSEDEARKQAQNFLCYGTLLLKAGKVDGFVSGSTHSTADTVRPALHIIKTKPGISTVSSVFFMGFPDRMMVYADCAVMEFPTAEELAGIALASAMTARDFGIPPLTAMLSYSTKGSGKSAAVTKVVEATKRAQQKLAELKASDKKWADVEIDGEFQLDAAIVPKVAALKAPGSKVGGRASVLIFPDLNAGNIGYKLTQRLAGARAIGPILQGLAKPVNDLSRGCSPEDIVAVVAFTVLQANAG